MEISVYGGEAFVRFLGNQRLKQPVFGALALLGSSGLAERLGPCGVGRGGGSLRALLDTLRGSLAPASADRPTWQVFVGETAWSPDRTRAMTMCAMLRDVWWSPAPLCGGRVPGEEAH